MSITINGATNTLTAASGLTIAGNTAVTGTLSATGVITKTNTAATLSNFFNTTGSTTEGAYARASNTSGTLQWGIEGAVGGGTLTGASAYSGFIGTVTNTDFHIQHNNTVVGTFSSTGLAVTGLLDLSAASSGQIKFPATQNASSDANTLDDYEEGTFTITASTGLTTTPSATAGYTKIGNAVTLSIPSLSGTSNAATFVLTGIPAAIRADAPTGQLFPVRVSDNGAASIWGLGYMSNNGSLYLYKNMDGGNDWTASGTKSVSFCTVHYMTKVV